MLMSTPTALLQLQSNCIIDPVAVFSKKVCYTASIQIVRVTGHHHSASSELGDWKLVPIASTNTLLFLA